MHKSLVLTVLGDDRPGLVETLSDIINRQQGNWMESRMAHLAGKFAGLLHVSVPERQYPALSQALQTELADLHIQIEDVSAAAAPANNTLNLALLGQDRPGIIHDVTQVLAQLNVNVEELSSEVTEASMSGEMLFQADLELSVPDTISQDQVRDALESLADQLMVDVKFD